MSVGVPFVDKQVSIDQMKKNLRNIIDTGRILSEAIKKAEKDMENRFTPNPV